MSYANLPESPEDLRDLQDQYSPLTAGVLRQEIQKSEIRGLVFSLVLFVFGLVIDRVRR